MPRPVNTYSVVARDAATGELGVAVQSHWFSVGTVVSWAEAGVGAVATQAMADPTYGPKGLELMRAGTAAPDALKALLEKDENREIRQVAFVDASGRVGSHTGSRCIASAGHDAGDGFSVQANMMLNDKVVPAMKSALARSGRPLCDRLLDSLDAAQAAGGDIRGKQSSAMIVVKKGHRLDLRVDDHPEPLKELRRILTIQKAYDHMNAGDKALEDKDRKAAMAEYKAAADLVPDSLEIRFWNAVTLATNGHVVESIPIFRDVFSRDVNWKVLLRRLPDAGILDAELAAKILDNL